MTQLVEFLKARLNEDEAHARNAFAEHNDAEAEWSELWSGAVQLGPHEELLSTHDSQVSRHIVHHDPARVLRDVEAKRRIVAVREDLAANHPADGSIGWYQVNAYDTVLRDLASIHSDHPDYRGKWRP